MKFFKLFDMGPRRQPPTHVLAADEQGEAVRITDQGRVSAETQGPGGLYVEQGTPPYNLYPY